jgi:hypothetical protein
MFFALFHRFPLYSVALMAFSDVITKEVFKKATSIRVVAFDLKIFCFVF